MGFLIALSPGAVVVSSTTFHAGIALANQTRGGITVGILQALYAFVCVHVAVAGSAVCMLGTVRNTLIILTDSTCWAVSGLFTFDTGSVRSQVLDTGFTPWTVAVIATTRHTVAIDAYLAILALAIIRAKRLLRTHASRAYLFTRAMLVLQTFHTFSILDIAIRQ